MSWTDASSRRTTNFNASPERTMRAIDSWRNLRPHRILRLSLLAYIVLAVSCRSSAERKVLIMPTKSDFAIIGTEPKMRWQQVILSEFGTQLPAAFPAAHLR
jgi:hypothetical protein